MKRALILLIAFVVVCFEAGGCKSSKNVINHEKIVIRAQIYLELEEEYYYFILTSDKELYVFKEDESPFACEPNGDVIVEGKRKIANLTDEEFDEIKGMVDNLGEFQGNDCNVNGSIWICRVFHQGDDIMSGAYFAYGCSVNENYDLLITKFIELSPMKIRVGGREAEPLDRLEN